MQLVDTTRSIRAYGYSLNETQRSQVQEEGRRLQQCMSGVPYMRLGDVLQQRPTDIRILGDNKVTACQSMAHRKEHPQQAVMLYASPESTGAQAP